MASIDEVIARSRQPGSFSKRQRFTVARSRAIRKMREFALADPHFFALELIQAAIANGATHIDIKASRREFGLTYVGAGFRHEELAQLFDFLFASKSSLEHVDVRQLALGINALMLMEPDLIEVESGDGTPSGSTRIAIQGRDDVVDVGRPERPIDGTYIRATGLDRKKIKKRSNLRALDYGPPECSAIETRCLAGPVPIFVNSHSVFGYQRKRTPSLLGCTRVIELDEGDLYGTLGLTRSNGGIKLLTFGTWIETISHDFGFVDARKFTGIICYDRLDKTADHAAIVRNWRLGEMWARLEPYARRLLSGDTDRAAYDVTRLDGEPIRDTRELRDLLRASRQVVVVPDLEALEDREISRAAQIGALLEHPVLCVPDEEVASLQLLGGPEVRIIQPDLSSDSVHFYRQSPLDEPPRPWLVAPVEVPAVPSRRLAHWVVGEGLVTRLDAGELARLLGDFEGPSDSDSVEVDASVLQEASSQELDFLESDEDDAFSSMSEVGARVYTPTEQLADSDTILVRVRITDRLAWEGRLPSVYPGHVLEVELPDVSPGPLRAPAHAEDSHDDAELVAVIAEAMARHAEPQLERATHRALRGLAHAEIAPGSNLSGMVMAALARDSILRLRSGASGEAPRPRIALLDDDPPFDLLSVPILETLDGRRVSVEDLVEMLAAHGGLLYGVIPEIEPDLEGLDTSRVLALDPWQERALMAIFGEACYVRIDRRDVLAEDPETGLVVRDMAIGLRAPGPDRALLVERGAHLESLDAEARLRAERALVDQLVRRASSHPTSWDEEENRRQAVRHLQHYVCRRAADTTTEAPIVGGVEHLALFVDHAGRPCTYAELREVARDRELWMFDGRAVDVCSARESIARREPERRPSALAMNPFVFELLGDDPGVRAAFDFDLSPAEALDEERSFLESVAVDHGGFEGTLGIPMHEPLYHTVALVSADRERVHCLRSQPQRFGVVGRLRETGEHDGDARDAVLTEIAQRGVVLLGRLIDGLGRAERGSHRYRRSVHVLLEFASQFLQLSAPPTGGVIFEVHHPTAQRILDLPLFAAEGGVAVSARRLVREFCAYIDGHDDLDVGEQWAPQSVHLEELPDALRSWIGDNLHPHRIQRPASHSAAHPAVEKATASQADGLRDPVDGATLSQILTGWLSRLRPDAPPRETEVVVGRIEAPVAIGGGGGLWPFGGSPKEPEDGTFEYTNYDRPKLRVAEDAELVRWAGGRVVSDPEALAWLLLAIYAHLNALLEPVTNEHERVFQKRVIRALEEGRLEATAVLS